MRCTKCHYLSFEPEPRCRNCGHDLSLEEGAAFSLSDATLHGGTGESRRAATAVLATPRTAATAASNRIPTSELPLFVQSMQGVADRLSDDDPEPEDLEPLVKVPARPRTPVSVRRTTPDPARLRAKYGLSPEPDLLSNISSDPIDQGELHDEVSAFQDLPLTSEPSMSWPSAHSFAQGPAGVQDAVGGGARLVSALIDATLLGGISALVIYFTLRVTGLSIAQITLLPALPLGGLLLMMTVGYLLMFTAASGQTVGKMAMNIRVVGTSADAVMHDRIAVSQAAVRTLAAVPSVLIFGLGFLPALLGAGPAAHDRIAHTRVVRR